MMGYLWLCEKCDGTGSVTEIWEGSHHLTLIFGGFLVPHIEHQETKFPAHVTQRCECCMGRGYWEAA